MEKQKTVEIERVLQRTADGSYTLYVPSLDEHYHSVNGAIQESLHVFIYAGLRQIQKKKIRILEIGFGTGLNAWLTLLETELAEGYEIEYYTVERFPLSQDIVRNLQYGESSGSRQKKLFTHLHEALWERPVKITDRFTLHKIEGDSLSCPLPEDIDLIFFDAFAPEKQPEMWEQSIFHKIYHVAAPGAILVTYCAKGEVRRRMQVAGFEMERLPGPPGKRHMLRGTAVIR